MKRVVKWALGMIAMVLLIVIALANRTPVALKVDPFASDGSLEIYAPLYILLILAFLAGILIGGTSSWLKGGRRRKESRAYRRQEKQHAKQNQSKAVALPDKSDADN